MSAESTILAGRAFNERLMTDEGTIGKYGETTDPGTLDVVESIIGDPHYTGIGRVKVMSSAVGDSNSGAQNFVAQQWVLCLPFGTAGDVRVDDVWVKTAVGSTGDPSTIGQKLRIAGDYDPTYATEHRFPVEVLS